MKAKQLSLEANCSQIATEREELERSLAQFHEDLQSAVNCSKALQEYR